MASDGVRNQNFNTHPSLIFDLLIQDFVETQDLQDAQVFPPTSASGMQP